MVSGSVLVSRGSRLLGIVASGMSCTATADAIVGRRNRSRGDGLLRNFMVYYDVGVEVIAIVLGVGEESV